MGRLTCWIYESDTEKSGHLKLELKVTKRVRVSRRDPRTKPWGPQLVRPEGRGRSRRESEEELLGGRKNTSRAWYPGSHMENCSKEGSDQVCPTVLTSQLRQGW